MTLLLRYSIPEVPKVVGSPLILAEYTIPVPAESSISQGNGFAPQHVVGHLMGVHNAKRVRPVLSVDGHAEDPVTRLQVVLLVRRNDWGALKVRDSVGPDTSPRNLGYVDSASLAPPEPGSRRNLGSIWFMSALFHSTYPSGGRYSSAFLPSHSIHPSQAPETTLLNSRPVITEMALLVSISSSRLPKKRRHLYHHRDHRLVVVGDGECDGLLRVVEVVVQVRVKPEHVFGGVIVSRRSLTSRRGLGM